MDVIKFHTQYDLFPELIFCLFDNTNKSINEAREIVKNQLDYTVSNITGKGYHLCQGTNEDKLLKFAVLNNFKHAVVFSSGTEFINGYSFFENITKYMNENVALAGHILDRNSGYYELHNQCYYINLEIYKDQNFPSIGKQELGVRHSQIFPTRSDENYHDDYTPLWINNGTIEKTYEHKCHGWNIISKYLKENLKIEIFDNSIRDNKIHLYSENKIDFNKNLGFIYHRHNYCANNFIHESTTEWDFDLPNDINQIVTPASGNWFEKLINQDTKVKIIFYDYNKSSLEFWKNKITNYKNIEYNFIYLDLFQNNFDIREIIDMSLVNKTLINFSNIFCYEGTCSLTSLDFRLYKENQILLNLKEYAPMSYIRFNMRSGYGFVKDINYYNYNSIASEIKLYNIDNLIKPSWHFTDWLD